MLPALKLKMHTSCPFLLETKSDQSYQRGFNTLEHISRPPVQDLLGPLDEEKSNGAHCADMEEHQKGTLSDSELLIFFIWKICESGKPHFSQYFILSVKIYMRCLANKLFKWKWQIRYSQAAKHSPALSQEFPRWAKVCSCCIPGQCYITAYYQSIMAVLPHCIIALLHYCTTA